ncbi:MAG: Hsp33 family molecular chaperone HslO [Clostridia bacterium]|nr:Hsp33 family molecular chaperone HslO [Clostridia bacterium]MDQ7791045.1 Hsp33 family molecular chaperone HslO [Clostridia bacterium]
MPQRAEPADDYKLPVGRAVGQGYLHVSRDLGLKQMFTGSVALVSGEIAEDLAHYFTASEQTPSAVSLGCPRGPGPVHQVPGGLAGADDAWG